MKISDYDIERAEKVFLPLVESFKDTKNERYDFIKCIDRSIHLQACPGSGKTTTLLAKIFLLSEHMPFENNQGICVLTHTNVAIDIIKRKLGDKADKLFSHPNYFGTIQSFVDKFLAIPAYIKMSGFRPSYIDDDFFINKITAYKKLIEMNQWLVKNKGHYEGILEFVSNIDLEFDSIEDIQFSLVFGIKDKKSKTYKLVQTVFQNIIRDGYLRYKDAFSISKRYLDELPVLKFFFSSRFKYVFIDEAQDTSQIQREIIERCFDDSVIIQWIGDPNQAILNDNNTKSAWEPKRDEKYDLLYLSDSKRVSQNIANLLKTVAVDKYNELKGKEIQSVIKPHLLIFDDNSKYKVLNKFAELVVETKSTYMDEEKSILEISRITGNPIKAIGWVGKYKKKSLTIKSYFPDFEKSVGSNKKLYFPNLYTMYQTSNKLTPKEFKNSVFNCILEALFISKIKNENGRHYTKNSIINYIKEKDSKLLDELYQKIVSSYRTESFDILLSAVRDTLEKLQLGLMDEAKKYLSEKVLSGIRERTVNTKNIYKPNIDGIEIEIPLNTVHSVKGETHSATLYLETKFYKNSILYFIEQLKGNVVNNIDESNKKALRIAHVAFSRPTHLLCIAIHKDNISNISTFQNFDIIYLWNCSDENNQN